MIREPNWRSSRLAVLPAVTNCSPTCKLQLDTRNSNIVGGDAISYLLASSPATRDVSVRLGN